MFRASGIASESQVGHAGQAGHAHGTHAGHELNATAAGLLLLGQCTWWRGLIVKVIRIRILGACII